MPSSDHERRPKKTTHRTGRHYEQLAATYLQQHGFEILERNCRLGRLEIDLIARRDDLVVFVEVKSAANLKFGHPAEKVDRRKTERLTRAAEHYLKRSGINRCDLRFDVVTFTGGRLEHFPAAFEAQP